MSHQNVCIETHREQDVESKCYISKMQKYNIKNVYSSFPFLFLVEQNMSFSKLKPLEHYSISQRLKMVF